MLPFNGFAKNIYSENGEDGIISVILERLNLPKDEFGWCCEFGAWDGKEASNTFALLERGAGRPYILKQIHIDSTTYQDRRSVSPSYYSN